MSLKIKGYLGRLFQNSEHQKLSQEIQEIKTLILNRIEDLDIELQSIQNKVTIVEKDVTTVVTTNHELLEKNKKLMSYFSECDNGQNNLLTNAFKDMNAFHEIKEISQEIKDVTKEVRNVSYATRNTSFEILWAEVYKSATENSSWLKNKAFAPGRWAAGYPFLYILYRILNDIKPCRILELGLGESTKEISQYVAVHTQVEHFIVEHDSSWIAYFKREFSLPENTKLVELPLDFRPYKDVTSVLGYKNFYQKFSNGKYDLIAIDGPFGEKDNKYSRIDVLQLIPDCLSDSFVIVMDDYNRITEKNTVKEICLILDTNNIEYVIGEYRGEKSTCVICSKDISFLTTL